MTWSILDHRPETGVFGIGGVIEAGIARALARDGR
jgi:hypothetical protein